MTIVEISSGNHGSVGNIMLGIADCARKEGHDVYMYCPPGHMQKKEVKGNKFIGTIFERRISDLINSVTAHQGSLNWFSTKAFLKDLGKIKPDIVHFHNLHSNYVNIPMLFAYLKYKKIQIVWTLHDCWPFTGHCPYFDIVNCYKWKTECHDCEMYTKYPATKFDFSRQMFQKKKELFTGLDDLVIVTPSQWLKNLTEQSFLNKFSVRLINNGIDLSIFYPRKSDFRERHNLQEKFIILSVAFVWGERKGQDRLERLAHNLSDRFKMVLVGTTGEEIDADNIICIQRTDNMQQLAEIYTAADVLLNPTREDNFPTVNIEALACGTPILSYGAGGSAEAFDEKSGMIVSDDNIIEVLDELYKHNFDREDCAIRGKQFEQNSKFQEYVRLYRELISCNK